MRSRFLFAQEACEIKAFRRIPGIEVQLHLALEQGIFQTVQERCSLWRPGTVMQYAVSAVCCLLIAEQF
jgi:hypothetical protein